MKPILIQIELDPKEEERDLDAKVYNPEYTLMRTPSIPQAKSGTPSAEETGAYCRLQTILPVQVPDESGAANGDPERMKLHHDLCPGVHNLQRNRTATGDTQEYKITFSYDDHIDPESNEAHELDLQGRGACTGDGIYIRDLKVGDVVTVWGKARFPGWANSIKSVSMEVYWAV